MADMTSNYHKEPHEQGAAQKKKIEAPEITENSHQKTITSTYQLLQNYLSPLPIPPKNDNANFHIFGSNYTFPSQIQEIPTPIIKQPPRFMGIQDSHAIDSKIIFRSKSEEAHSDSSGSQSEEDEDGEQPSLNNSSLNQQLSFSSPLRQLQQYAEKFSQDLGNVIQNRPTQNKKASKPQGRMKNSKQTHSKKKAHCNCKKTLCLKLYCDCFRMNETCQGCNCFGCHNSQIYYKERNRAINTLLDRNPDPFAQKIEFDLHLKGCNCKKSNCLKKYCECYQAGLKCGINCKCEQCKNMQLTQTDKREPESQRAVFAAKATAKKQKRMVEM